MPKENTTQDNGINLATDAIGKMLKELYDRGGTKLAVLGLGAVVMLGAFIYGQSAGASRPFGHVFLFTGFLLIAFALVFTWLQELRPLADAQAKLQSNKDMIDTIQIAAVDLSDLALELQTLAVKHSDDINRVITSIRPQIRNIPLVGPLIADSDQVKGIETLSESITATAMKAKRVLLDLKQALEKSDPTRLKGYLAELEAYTQEVRELLNQPKAPACTDGPN